MQYSGHMHKMLLTLAQDGSTDLFEWACVVPGKKASYMEEGNFPVTIRFTDTIPTHPATAPMQQGSHTANSSEPGPSTPPPAKSSKRTKAEQAAEPTQPTKGIVKGKAASPSPPALQPGRWVDQDCNAALDMQDYPSKPPAVFLPPGFLHVNVFDNGGVCLSMLKTEMPQHLTAVAAVDAWRPSITVNQILLAIQELLHNPHFGSVANWDAYNLRERKGMAAYERRMRQQATQYNTPPTAE
ncbi:hypothetical protein QJQ45_004064 [Haematococcus lacustris]|nr:hypothetical protein QJQ45_004064 [Haematococcus lacustris]